MTKLALQAAQGTQLPVNVLTTVCLTSVLQAAQETVYDQRLAFQAEICLRVGQIALWMC